MDGLWHAGCSSLLRRPRSLQSQRSANASIANPGARLSATACFKRPDEGAPSCSTLPGKKTSKSSIHFCEVNSRPWRPTDNVLRKWRTLRSFVNSTSFEPPTRFARVFSMHEFAGTEAHRKRVPGSGVPSPYWLGEAQRCSANRRQSP